MLQVGLYTVCLRRLQRAGLVNAALAKMETVSDGASGAALGCYFCAWHRTYDSGAGVDSLSEPAPAPPTAAVFGRRSRAALTAS